MATSGGKPKTQRKTSPKPVGGPDLGTAGQQKYAELLPDLLERTPLTLDQLLIYCRAYDHWTVLQAGLTESRGVVVRRNRDGLILSVSADPRIKVCSDLERDMREAATFLSSRMREGSRG